MQEKEEMTGLILATSNSQWVRDLSYHQQWTSFTGVKEMFPTWGQVFAQALSNHQISNLRGGHKLPQCSAAIPDLWNYTLWAHLCIAKTWLGRCWMYLVGSPKSQFILAVWFCSKQRWSLSLWFKVWGTKGDKTPSYYTSNSKVLNKGIQANLGYIQLVGTNNEHLPVCLYSCSLRGNELAGIENILPSKAETWT